MPCLQILQHVLPVQQKRTALILLHAAAVMHAMSCLLILQHMIVNLLIVKHACISRSLRTSLDSGNGKTLMVNLPKTLFLPVRARDHGVIMRQRGQQRVLTNKLHSACQKTIITIR